MTRKRAHEYSVVVWRDSRDGRYRARCLEIPAADIARPTAEAALRVCWEAIEDHLWWREKRGFSLPKAGTAPLLFSRRLHRAIAAAKRRVTRGKQPRVIVRTPYPTAAEIARELGLTPRQQKRVDRLVRAALARRGD